MTVVRKKKRAIITGMLTAGCLFLAGAVCPLHFPTAHAGISTDGTLGARMTLPGPDYIISSDLGQISGARLFHSFHTFDLLKGESASFTGPSTVTGIFSRITGGSPSEINGTIRSGIHSADLYFLNPAGMIFGPDAVLDVTGSFHASTADYVRFSDHTRFSVSAPDAPLLSSSPVAAFGFLNTPADIRISGSGLTVPTGKTLSFTCGNLDMDAGYLTARSGRINLAAAGAAGEVGIESDSIDLTGSPSGGGITLTNGSVVSTEGGPSGDIYIRAGNLTVSGSSKISAANFGTDPGGIVDIDLTDTLLIDTNGQIDVSSYMEGNGGHLFIDTFDLIMNGADSQYTVSGIKGIADYTGNGGDVTITAGNSVELSDGAKIETSTSSAGNAGDIEIHAAHVLLDGDEYFGSGLFAMVNFSSGNGGDISVLTSGLLEILSGAKIATSTYGDGNAGDIRIESRDITIDGSGEFTTGILNNTYNYGNGGSGNIDITASGLLEIVNAGIISSVTSGDGHAGDILINAGDIIIDGHGSLWQTGIESGTQKPNESEDTTGNGGNIRIDSGTIRLLGHGTVDVSINGYGDSGFLSVNADSIHINGADSAGYTGFSMDVDPYTKGGNCRYMAFNIKNMLEILNGGTISSSVYGIGNGGDIFINAGAIHMEGVREGIFPIEYIIIAGLREGIDSFEYRIPAGISTAVGFEELEAGDWTLRALGLGGDIYINAAGPVTIADHATISSSSYSVYDAGDITITAPSLFMKNLSIIDSETLSHEGGNITLDIRDILHLSNSWLTTSVRGGRGNGGNIDIKDPTFLILDYSDIIANAYEGNGGNIDLAAAYLFEDVLSRIEASSELGIDGEISIDTPDIDLSASFAALPGLTKIPELTQSACESSRDDTASSLISTGRGGLAENPEVPLPASPQPGYPRGK